MIPPLSIGKFASGWLPVLAVSASVDPVPRLADALMLDLGGFQVPVLTCALGLLGVVLARPLAKRRETTVGWGGFALVSLIMLIVTQLWIVESRPGALFAFVIAIGLGFSGYSLIELVGAEIGSFVKRLVRIPTDALNNSAKNPASEDPPK